MKKYNNFDRHMVLLGIIIPFLVFFISMNTTYAYFTATTTEKKSTTVTATIHLSFKDENNSSTVQAVSDGGSENLLPGDTLQVSGSLFNKGTGDCYAVMEFIVTVTKKDSTAVETVKKEYYTFVGSTLTEITGVENNYSQQAQIIPAETEKAFTGSDLFYEFDGETYGNEYKQATVNYYINAYGIQTANLASTSAQSQIVATNLLMQNAGYNSTKVFGETTQDGTPTPTSPVALTNTGRISKNLFNAKAITRANITVSDNGTKIYMPIVTGGNGITPTGCTLSQLCPNLKIGDTVFLSFKTSSAHNKWIYLETVTDLWVNNTSRTITQSMLDSSVDLYANRFVDGETHQVVISDLQVELGDTATEYEPYGKYVVEAGGKNLFDINNPLIIYHSQYEINGTHSPKIENNIIYSGGLAGDTAGGMLVIPTNGQRTFTFSCNTNSTTCTIQIDMFNSYNKQTLIADTYNVYGRYRNTATITLPEDYAYIGISSYDSQKYGAQLTNFQIEVGDTATAYEPYFEPFKVFLDEPLRSVGDVADYLDVETGTVVRNVKYREFSSTDNWSKYVSVENHFQIVVGDNYYTTSDNIMSNYYYSDDPNRGWSLNDYAVMSVDGDRIRFKNKDCSTLEQWVAYLETLSEPLCVIYKLAQPTTEQAIVPGVQIPDGVTIVVR